MRRVEVVDVVCYVWENARFQFGIRINYNIIDFDQQMKWLSVCCELNWIDRWMLFLKLFCRLN